MVGEVDGVLRGQVGPMGISGVLHSAKGEISIFFLDSVVVRDSSKAELLGVKRALVL